MPTAGDSGRAEGASTGSDPEGEVPGDGAAAEVGPAEGEAAPTGDEAEGGAVGDAAEADTAEDTVTAETVASEAPGVSDEAGEPDAADNSDVTADTVAVRAVPKWPESDSDDSAPDDPAPADGASPEDETIVDGGSAPEDDHEPDTDHAAGDDVATGDTTAGDDGDGDHGEETATDDGADDGDESAEVPKPAADVAWPTTEPEPAESHPETPESEAITWPTEGAGVTSAADEPDAGTDVDAYPEPEPEPELGPEPEPEPEPELGPEPEPEQCAEAEPVWPSQPEPASGDPDTRDPDEPVTRTPDTRTPVTEQATEQYVLWPAEPPASEPTLRAEHAPPEPEPEPETASERTELLPLPLPVADDEPDEPPDLEEPEESTQILAPVVFERRPAPPWKPMSGPEAATTDPLPKQRTAEAEHEPEPPAVPPQEPPPPVAGGDTGGGGSGGRRRRRWRAPLIAVGSLVVVVAVAAGVVLWVPGVAAKLGLSDVGTVAAPPDQASVRFAVRPVGSDAPEPTPAGMSAALRAAASDPALGTLTGKVIDPASGDTLWKQDPEKPLAPGSANKVLTAAAALFVLDHDATLDTTVVAGGEPGTAILVGGGDPTLSSLPVGDRSVYWQPAHLSQLVKKVKQQSGGAIDTVYLDPSRYTGPRRADGWTTQDIEAGNWTPIVPAMLDGGRSDPTRAEGTPRTPHPNQELLQAFAGKLGAKAGGIKTAPENAKVLGVVHSAPVDELVANMLTISDNVLAEALGREIARSQGMPESFEGAYKAVLRVLSQHGFDVSGATLADSSGLSTVDRVPAALLASVLAVASRPGGGDERTAALRPLLAGLPVAGGSGSLKHRFEDAAAQHGRGWVRAKTGTLSKVNTLSGLVTDRDGRILVFAFMSNGTAAADARPALDTLASALRDCGCGG